MIKIDVRSRISIEGLSFGARGCSSACSCNPCDCDPCEGGSSLHAGPQYPRWRVSGYHITAGELQGVDVSGLTLIGLSQPAEEGDNEHWQEVILVEQGATDEQTTALLSQFEGQLESMPAEVGNRPRFRRAVYRAALDYHDDKNEPDLHAVFLPDAALLIRPAVDQAPLRGWSYDGPMAVRGTVNVIH